MKEDKINRRRRRYEALKHSFVASNVTALNTENILLFDFFADVLQSSLTNIRGRNKRQIFQTINNTERKNFIKFEKKFLKKCIC